jgi:hypothetical protein
LTDSTATERLLFPEIFDKPVMLEFDQRQGSSDGGAVLLKAAERRYGLISSMADCLFDRRQAGKVGHSLNDLIAQRVFSIACGYADANDSARLTADPMHKMLLDRDPVTGLDMASQPTLSRFENAVGPHQLYHMGAALAESVIERHAQRLRHRARRVTIDLDPTDDPTHGAQQLSFFNSHYDNSCYLPMMGFVTFNDEAEQYLCASVLRPGNVTAASGAVGILRRLMGLIRRSFPQARIRVRLDGGFANPQLLAFLDDESGVEYAVAMASNAVLNRKAEEAMKVARVLAGLTDQTEHIYGEASYAAGTWKQERRIIIKAEVVRAEDKAPKDNPRFVITNMKQTPQWLYEKVYCQRGEIGVSSQGHIIQPVQVRPRLTDSSLVAWEASWSESETMKPSDNMLRKEYAQLTRLQCAVNADVASLPVYPEAETVDNARKQQEPIETSPIRRLSPAGYQRRHGEKENVSTGEALGVRRRNLVEEATAITASGKCSRRRQGGGSGRTTVDGRAAKRVRREGPGPVSIPLNKVRQG